MSFFLLIIAEIVIISTGLKVHKDNGEDLMAD